MDDLVRNLLLDMRTDAGHAIRAIEVVGEASWKIDTTFNDKHTSIAWAQMTGMRHRHIHGYGQINLETVFSTVMQFLSEFLVQLDEVLGDT